MNKAFGDNGLTMKSRCEKMIRDAWKRIELAAEERKISLGALAESMGLASSAVYEANRLAKRDGNLKETDLYTFIKLAEGLNLSLNYVLYGCTDDEEEEVPTPISKENIFHHASGKTSNLIIITYPFLSAKEKENVYRHILSYFKDYKP